MNMYQRLSAPNLKKIMGLSQEREELMKQVTQLQQRIGEIDAKMAALYGDTYTDRQTTMYVPQEFAHELLHKSSSSLRKLASKSRATSKK